MKKLKTILLAGVMTAGIFSTAVFTSCNSDACADVVCSNGGSCVDGTCACPAGYEGAKCETESRTKLIGNYLMSGTDNTGGTYTNVPATTTTSSASKTKFLFAVASAGLSLTCTMSAANAFVIDNQTLSGTTYSGSGTYNGSTLTMILNEVDNTGTTVYNWSGNKQ